MILPHSTPDQGSFVFMPCYSLSLSNSKLKMTELIINGMELGEIARNFFGYKCFVQLAPTVHEYTMRQGGM